MVVGCSCWCAPTPLQQLGPRLDVEISSHKLCVSLATRAGKLSQVQLDCCTLGMPQASGWISRTLKLIIKSNKKTVKKKCSHPALKQSGIKVTIYRNFMGPAAATEGNSNPVVYLSRWDWTLPTPTDGLFCMPPWEFGHCSAAIFPKDDSVSTEIPGDIRPTLFSNIVLCPLKMFKSYFFLRSSPIFFNL